MSLYRSLYSVKGAGLLLAFLLLVIPGGLTAKDRTPYKEDLDKAVTAAKEKNYIKARKHIRKVILRAPHSSYANYLMGRILLSIPRDTRTKTGRQQKRQEIRQAVKHLKLAAKQDPNNARIHFYLGFAYLFAQYRDQAYYAFKKAVQLDQKYIESYYNMAKIMEEKGNRTAARTLYKKYLKKHKLMQDKQSNFDDFF